LLKEALPRVSRVAFLWNPVNPLNAAVLKETETAATMLSVKLEPIAVRAPEDLQSVLVTAAEKRVEALVVAPDPMLLLNRKSMIDFAATNRLPAMYNFREETESEVSYRTGQTYTTPAGAPRRLWTRFSRAPSPPNCLSNSPPGCI